MNKNNLKAGGISSNLRTAGERKNLRFLSNLRTGKIYKIVCGQTNKCYIGSTFSKLKYRFYRHKQNYKDWKNGNYNYVSVFGLFDEFGVENFKMILVKEYKVVDGHHLRMYEQLWLNKLKPKVNINMSFCIKKLRNKLYSRGYRKRNYADITEYNRKYRKINKDKIGKKLRTKRKCSFCDSMISLRNMAQHKKTKKCKKLSLIKYNKGGHE